MVLCGNKSDLEKYILEKILENINKLILRI